MIVFQGIKITNKIAFLLLSNEQNQVVEIPIEIAVADRISKYLSKIATAPTGVLERGNDGDSE
ncbi:MAG TPA: hypothetical protein VM577_08585 [Anaerovoracaceae bacterium]|nr:hypothetical protein [Anaerovoracaceae bacterium]